MRRSSSRRSTALSPGEPPAPELRGADVYLMPSVIGGGRGDVEEVLVVGRSLASAGYRVQAVRSRPLPVLDDPSFDWAGIRRTSRLVPRALHAVTISSQFGITAEDARDEPLGKAGPWADERGAIDRAYGPGRVLHISLEEFARARPVAELAEERWRESGSTAEDRRARRRSPAFRREVEEFTRLYRKFRALDRSDLLPIFPTFRPSAAFARGFPETVQTGPIWPEPGRSGHTGGRSGPFRVLWYASPSTSERLGPRLLDGLARSGRPIRLEVRSPRSLLLAPSGEVRVVPAPSRSARQWRRAWNRTDLAIVTGSRSLLEAISWEVPFLYFNGVLGRGRSARRHRPEKLQALLAVLRKERTGPADRMRRDLGDFSRLRRVEAIVDRWVRRPAPLGPAVRRGILGGFPEGFEDGGALVRSIVDRFASADWTANELVRAVRRESRRRRAGRRRRVSKV